MVYSLIIFFSIVLIGFFIQWKRFKKTSVEEENPFELTEFVQNTPTPTPAIEKKKKIRKTKKG